MYSIDKKIASIKKENNDRLNNIKQNMLNRNKILFGKKSPKKISPWEKTKEIGWDMSESLSKTFKIQKLDKTLLDKKLPIEKGDQITVLKAEGIPILTKIYDRENNTFKDLLEVLEKALSTPIKVNIETTPRVYLRIGSFSYREDRLFLIKKFERGMLTPKELLGDHRFFSGFYKDKNIIDYEVSS